MNPGVTRNASTQIIVCRSRMSDVTVSLAKNRAKKARKRIRREGWSAPLTSVDHRRHQAARPLRDVVLGDQRCEHGIERRQLQRRTEIADRIVADDDAVLE